MAEVFRDIPGRSDMASESRAPTLEPEHARATTIMILRPAILPNVIFQLFDIGPSRFYPGFMPQIDHPLPSPIQAVIIHFHFPRGPDGGPDQQRCRLQLLE